MVEQELPEIRKRLFSNSGRSDDLPERWRKPIEKLREQESLVREQEEREQLARVAERLKEERPGGVKRAVGATAHFLGETVALGAGEVGRFYEKGVERRRAVEAQRRGYEGVDELPPRKRRFIDPFTRAIQVGDSMPKPDLYATSRSKFDAGVQSQLSKRQSIYDSYHERQRELMRRTNPFAKRQEFRRTMSDFDARTGRYKSKHNAYAKYRE